VERLKIYNLDTNKEVLSCQFNPDELSFSKSNTWQETNSAGSKLPDVQFKGEGLQTMDLSLTFDTFECEPPIAVTHRTGALLALMQADIAEGAQTDKNNQSRPPHLQLLWGKTRSQPMVLTQVSQKFTLFTSDGTPVRATLQVKLQEIPDTSQKKGQNPTSRAAGARRVRVVEPGDTLDWISAQELGDPGAWRMLAEANALEDPRRLQPGMYLIIPPEA
jgi:hypothetical protein